MLLERISREKKRKEVLVWACWSRKTPESYSRRTLRSQVGFSKNPILSGIWLGRLEVENGERNHFHRSLLVTENPIHIVAWRDLNRGPRGRRWGKKPIQQPQLHRNEKIWKTSPMYRTNLDRSINVTSLFFHRKVMRKRSMSCLYQPLDWSQFLSPAQSTQCGSNVYHWGKNDNKNTIGV